MFSEAFSLYVLDSTALFWPDWRLHKNFEYLLSKGWNNDKSMWYFDFQIQPEGWLNLTPSKVQSIKERRNQVEKLFDFKIAAFFCHLHGEGEKAAISNLQSFSTEWRRSYIDCALVMQQFGQEIDYWRDCGVNNRPIFAPNMSTEV